MYWARLENNKVVEIIDFDPDGIFSSEWTFVECPDGVKQNDRYVNGEWLEPEIVIPTLDEIRVARNILLNQSDWTQLADLPLTEAKLEEWKTYRQELRDFPSSVDLNNIVWPTKPQ